MKKTILTVAVAFCILEIAHSQVFTKPPSYIENSLTVYRAEPERHHNLIHTKINIGFDYQKQEASGEVWITLKPHFYTTDQLVLDAKNMKILEVSLVDGKALKKLTYVYDDQQLFITLDKSYKRSETYDIYIKYIAQPNKVTQEGSAAIQDAKGLYFINPMGNDTDKPIQIWTQGETESSSCWFPTIDKTNQKSTSEIYMTVPEQYVTLSNGVLAKQTNNNDGTRTDYWKMDQKHAPYLFFMGIGDFSVIKDQWKDIPVNYYVEKEYGPYAKQIFGDTPAMMQFFSDLLEYPYPWVKYDQMVGRDFVSGAMENTTATLHMEQAQQKPGQLIDENIWESVIAHELFHHWFGDLVTSESWSNLTVNESFANYSEYLWFEHKYGKDKAEDHRLADLSAYQSGNGYEKDLVRIHYNSREDMFDDISYNKGGMGVLHMLRNYLGDDAFFKGLNRYLKQNEYGKAEATQLRLALEEVSGRDLNWFFNQWYYGSGHPKLTVKQTYDAASKKITIDVQQNQKTLFEFPLDIDIIRNGEAERHQVWIPKQETSKFVLDAVKKPDVVLLNPEKVILVEIDENRTIEENITAYTSSNASYGTRKEALDRLYDYQENAEVLKTLKLAISDPYHGLRKEVIEHLKLSSENVKKVFINDLKTIAEKDKKTIVQAAALTALSEAEIKDIPLFEKALKSTSFSVQSAALSYLIKNNPSKIETYIQNIDEDVLAKNEDASMKMIPRWIKNNDLSKAKLIAESAAFYYLAKFQDPEIGKILEEGFDWIMKNDTPDATNKVAKIYRQLKKEMGNEPQVKMVIKIMITNGLTQKKDALKKDATSQSMHQQVKLLEDLLKEF